jgi:hypothetical protein
VDFLVADGGESDDHHIEAVKPGPCPDDGPVGSVRAPEHVSRIVLMEKGGESTFVYR